LYYFLPGADKREINGVIQSGTRKGNVLVLFDLDKHSSTYLRYTTIFVTMKVRKLVVSFSALMMLISLSGCFLTKKKCDCPKFSRTNQYHPDSYREPVSVASTSTSRKYQYQYQ